MERSGTRASQERVTEEFQFLLFSVLQIVPQMVDALEEQLGSIAELVVARSVVQYELSRLILLFAEQLRESSGLKQSVQEVKQRVLHMAHAEQQTLEILEARVIERPKELPSLEPGVELSRLQEELFLVLFAEVLIEEQNEVLRGQPDVVEHTEHLQ